MNGNLHGIIYIVAVDEYDVYTSNQVIIFYLYHCQSNQLGTKIRVIIRWKIATDTTILVDSLPSKAIAQSIAVAFP